MNNLGPNPQDPNSPLYQFIDTQPTSPYPNNPDSSLSHITTTQITPTAITATWPVIVTAPSHGLQNGNAVRTTKFIRMPLANRTGMEQLNNRLFLVEQVTTDTFALYDEKGYAIDGTGYTSYISGGQFTYCYNTPLTVNPANFPPPGIPQIPFP